MHPAFWLVLAAWLALMAYVSSLLPGLAGVLVPAVLAAGAAAAVVGGARGLAAWLARPAETSFRAQVIARWVEHSGANDDDSYITCIAVDDGERSWSFDVSGAAFGQLALGDTVTVRASPRSGKLLGLVAGQDGPGDGAAAPRRAGTDPAAGRAGADPAAGRPSDGRPRRAPGRARRRSAAADEEAGATPPGALLAAGEVSAAVGRPVRATGLTSPGRQHGVPRRRRHGHRHGRRQVPGQPDLPGPAPWAPAARGRRRGMAAQPAAGRPSCGWAG